MGSQAKQRIDVKALLTNEPTHAGVSEKAPPLIGQQILPAVPNSQPRLLEACPALTTTPRPTPVSFFQMTAPRLIRPMHHGFTRHV